MPSAGDMLRSAVRDVTVYVQPLIARTKRIWRSARLSNALTRQRPAAVAAVCTICIAVLLFARYVDRSTMTAQQYSIYDQFVDHNYINSTVLFQRYIHVSDQLRKSAGYVDSTDTIYMHNTSPTRYMVRFQYSSKEYVDGEWQSVHQPTLQYIPPNCTTTLTDYSEFKLSMQRYEPFPTQIHDAYNALQYILQQANTRDTVPYLDILVNVNTDPTQSYIMPVNQYVANATADVYRQCIFFHDIEPTYQLMNDGAVMDVQQCAEHAVTYSSTHYAMQGNRHVGKCYVRMPMWDRSKQSSYTDNCNWMMFSNQVLRGCGRDDAHTTEMNMVHLYQTLGCDATPSGWTAHQYSDRMPAVFTFAANQVAAPSHFGYFDVPLLPRSVHHITKQQVDTVLDTLSQYSRLQPPPWLTADKPLDIFVPCNISRCHTSCCCSNQCVMAQGLPTDNTGLYGHAVSQADADLRNTLVEGNRVAVVYSGEMRSFANAYSFSRTFMIATAGRPVDLYMHVWSDNVKQTQEDIQRILRYHDDVAVALVVEPPPVVPDNVIRAIQCHSHETTATTAFTLQAESLRRADALRQQGELRQQHKYKWVVRMRYDVAIKKSFWPSLEFHNLPYDKKSFTLQPIYYPSCGQFLNGMNDQFAVGSSDAMVKYMSRANWMDRCIGDNIREGMHPETCYRALANIEYMADTQIHLINVCYMVIRVDSCHQPAVYGLECCNRACQLGEWCVAAFEPGGWRLPCLPNESLHQCQIRKSYINDTCTILAPS